MRKLLLSLELFFIFFFFSGCYRHSLAKGEPEPVPSRDPSLSSPKIALVLGGGGSKGLAHLGVIRELEEAGIHPDLIIGCSSGALIGALYAADPNVNRLEHLLLNLKRSDLIDFSLISSRFGFVKGSSLELFLKKELNVASFEALKIPLIVIATDLHTGELVEFSGGSLIPALCSSSAVPGIFKPVFYLGRHLIDGGVVAPIPASIAKKYGAQVIIAVDIGGELVNQKIVNFLGIVKRSLDISYRQLSKEVAREADILLQMNFQGLGIFNDNHNREIYERGRFKTRESLRDIEKILSEKLVDEF